MANNFDELNIKVTADTSDFYKSFQQIGKILSNTNDKLNPFQKYLASVEDKFDGISKVVSVVNKQIAAAQNSFAKALSTGDLAEQTTAIEALQDKYHDFAKLMKQIAPIMAQQFVFDKSDIDATREAIERITDAENRMGNSAKDSAAVFEEIFKAERIENATKRFNDFTLSLDPAKQKAKQLKEQFEELKKKYIELASAPRQTKKIKEQLAGIESQLALNKQGFLSQAEKDEADNLAKAKSALIDFETSLDPAKQKLYELQQRLKDAEEEFIKLKMAGQDTSSAEKSIKSIKKEMDKLQNSSKKTSGWVSKLMGRIRNISIYRAIRSGIKWITSGVQEGIQNFVQYDDSANQSLSNINASFQQIRNTMGIAFTSVLQSLEPVITSVTNSLVSMLDAFNYAMAKVSGKDYYVRAKKNVEDYAESLEDAKGALADFDKFRSLSDTTTTPAEDMFETVKLVDEEESRLSQFFEHLIETLQAVGSIIKSVFTSLEEEGIFDMLLDGFTVIAKTIGDIVVAVAKFVKMLADAKLLVPILTAIAAGFIAVKLAAVGAAIANAAAFMMAHPLAGGAIIAAALAAVGAVASMLGGGGTAVSNIQSGSGFSTVDFVTSNYTSSRQSTISSITGNRVSSTMDNSNAAQSMADAVSDGCYRGVIDALSDAESVSGSTTSSASVEVQGETIFTIVRDVARQKGFKFAKV